MIWYFKEVSMNVGRFIGWGDKKNGSNEIEAFYSPVESEHRSPALKEIFSKLISEIFNLTLPLQIVTVSENVWKSA